MKLLRNINNVKALTTAVSKCEDDVILRSMDNREQYNLKSEISMIVAISRLCGENGDEYEVFCSNPADERNMMEFFREVNDSTPHTAA